MLFRKYLFHSFKIFCSALLVLWTADVVVNLRLLQRIVLGHGVQGRIQDFIGLLLSETQIALVAAVISIIGGALLALPLRSRDAAKESVPILSGVLVALMVLGQTRVAWLFTGPQIRQASAIAFGSGVLYWAVLRFVLKKYSGDICRAAVIIKHGILPMLILGFGSLAFAQISRGDGERAIFNGAAAIVTLAATIMVARRNSSRWKSAVGWSPVLMAFFITAFTLIATNTYGRRETRIEGDDSKNQPDIILIVLDTVRADHLELYGYTRKTMPALNRWAHDATVFRRAVAPSGWTSPTHASIFSGLPVSLHGVHGTFGETTFYLPAVDGISWFPEELASEGYYCLAVVANHYSLPHGVTGFNKVLSPRRNYWRGSSIGACFDHFSPLLQRANELTGWRMPYHSADQIVDITMRAVPEEDGPTFLFINLFDAHSPYNPPASALKLLELSPEHLFSRYRSDRELSRLWKSLPVGKKQVLKDLYDAELREMDLQLDKLLRWIDQRFGKETVIVITSDHGEELGEEDRVGHGYGLSQSLIHVPLIVRSSDLISGDIEEEMTIRRIYNFLCSLGTAQEASLEDLIGIDEYGLISERYRSGFDIQTLGSEYNRDWVSLIDGEYKAVGPSEFGFQFFRLGMSDFSKEMLTADSSPAQRLKTQIDSYWEKHRDRREETQEFEPISDEELERLRSLGYVD